MSGKFALTTREIQVTDAARDYLAGLVAAHNAAGLRLAIMGGKGCGGSEYDLDVAHAPEVGDDVLEVNANLKIFIPMKDTIKLFGTCIDYRADEVGNSRLIIENPNEKGRCGCGSSVVF